MTERQATLRGKPVTVTARELPCAVHVVELTPEMLSELAREQREAQFQLMELPQSALAAAKLRVDLKQRGHAQQPGTGPGGETCGSCRFLAAIQGGNRTFSKCDLMRRHWTHGSASDVRKRDPACASWLAKAAKS